ncbi:hypothetical protein [Streptomyces sp. NPDC048527]|uniref:hypothetical protein n=1 Tax=Streptomyces sp. NPDC048527 TaxID=3365568 RepID=UPI00371694A7
MPLRPPPAVGALRRLTAPQVRTGNTITASVPLFADNAGHNSASLVDSARTSLYRNGELVSGQENLPMGAGTGDSLKSPRVYASYDRGADWIRTAVLTHRAWVLSPAAGKSD